MKSYAAERLAAMKKLFFSIVLLFMWIISALAKDKGFVLNGVPYEPVAFCNLISHPTDYDGKRVAIRASYALGFEQQQIFCAKCEDKGYVWLELSMEESVQKASRKSGIYSATLYGTFYKSAARFCHECPFRFAVNHVEDWALIYRGSGHETMARLPEKARRKVCQGDEMPR
jgi:hypothetical protein